MKRFFLASLLIFAALFSLALPVRAKLEDGSEVRIKATGEMARTLLHEIDHLDGILFIDRIRDDKKAFYRMSDKGELVSIEDYESEIRDNKELWND